MPEIVEFSSCIRLLNLLIDGFLKRHGFAFNETEISHGPGSAAMQACGRHPLKSVKGEPISERRGRSRFGTATQRAGDWKQDKQSQERCDDHHHVHSGIVKIFRANEQRGAYVS